MRRVSLPHVGRSRSLQARRDSLACLSSHKYCFNELLAINNTSSWRSSRDNTLGLVAKFKHIVAFRHRRRQRREHHRRVANQRRAHSIHSVAKHPFIDLLDPRFGLTGKAFPEKIEGPAFGLRPARRPSHPDRHVGQRLHCSSRRGFGSSPSPRRAFAVTPDFFISIAATQRVAVLSRWITTK